MKKLLISAAALALAAGAAAADPVRIGVAAEPYPPFTAPDASGQWVGWEIDIMNAICEREQMECVLTPTAWDGIIPALVSGRIDAIMSSMSITEDRLQTIDFSDKYYNTPAEIIGTRGEAITPTPEGLAGRVLGVQVSTIHQAYAQQYFEGQTEIRTYQTQDEANQDLAAGRLDAVLADSLALADFLASDAGQACCEDFGPVANDPEILGRGVGVGVRKGDNELLAHFNDGIASIIADGTYDEISSRYFASSIYGD
ncbi:MAG: transporter substrate-binding domain-containing protein [Rhodobacteraceae bacterium]|nr:transporter substrate-binding domain-containing protein [Paracoccaceae bacterium]